MRTRFVTQTDEPPPWIDCTWATLAMAVYFWTNGRVLYDKDTLRAASGDRVGGSNFMDCRKSLDVLGHQMPPFSYFGGIHLTASQAWALMGQGVGLHVMGNMGSVSAHWRRWSPNFRGFHSVWMQDRENSRSWWMDPLGRGTYRGEWMAFNTFKAFTEGVIPGSPGILVTPYRPGAGNPVEPPPPHVEGNEMLSLPRGTLFPQIAVLPDNTVFHDRPDPDGAQVGIATPHQQMQYAGYPDAANKWRMVVREIAMPSGPPALKVVYVTMDRVEQFIPNPLYPDD